MAIKELFKAAKIVETLENYALATYHISDTLQGNNTVEYFSTDAQFWNSILSNPEIYWGKRISFGGAVLSNWIPRVPGLYWTKEAYRLRQMINERHLEDPNNILSALSPDGKSRMVLGGLGTLRLAPNDEGKILFSICTSADTSMGIPVLIYPEVADFHKIREGDLVHIKNARWQAMSNTWSMRFPTTTGIPKGMLVVDHGDQITVTHEDLAVYAHPFSIMEYQRGDAILFDYVFCTIDTIQKGGNQDDPRTFFERYAHRDGRLGRYWTNPDMINPMFAANFMNPSELQHPLQRVQLELLHKRIISNTLKEVDINELINELPRYYNNAQSLFSLARAIGVNESVLMEDNAATMSAQLINYAIDAEIIDKLIDRITKQYPEILKG